MLNCWPSFSIRNRKERRVEKKKIGVVMSCLWTFFFSLRRAGTLLNLVHKLKPTFSPLFPFSLIIILYSMTLRHDYQTISTGKFLDPPFSFCFFLLTDILLYIMPHSILKVDEPSGSLSAEEHIDPQLEARLIRKLDTRLLPFLSLMYLFSSLDRSSLGKELLEWCESCVLI